MVCFEDKQHVLADLGMVISSFGYVAAPLLSGIWWYACFLSPSVSAFLYYILMVYFSGTFTADPERILTYVLIMSIVFTLLAIYAGPALIAIGSALILGVQLYHWSAVLGHWMNANISSHATIISGFAVIMGAVFLLTIILVVTGVGKAAWTVLVHLARFIVAGFLLAFFIDVLVLESTGDDQLCYGDPKSDPKGRSPLSLDRPVSLVIMGLLIGILCFIGYSSHRSGFCGGRCVWKEGQCWCKCKRRSVPDSDDDEEETKPSPPPSSLPVQHCEPLPPPLILVTEFDETDEAIVFDLWAIE